MTYIAISHGTNSAYSKRNCRCRDCMAWKAEAGRKYRKRRQELFFEDPSTVTHGTTQGYGFGCRCIECRAARFTYLYKMPRDVIGRIKDDFIAQDGKCLICHRDDQQLNIDHDHETNEYRGLICALCNRGIGQMQESADLLLAAAKYLIERKSK